MGIHSSTLLIMLQSLKLGAGMSVSGHSLVLQDAKTVKILGQSAGQAWYDINIKDIIGLFLVNGQIKRRKSDADYRTTLLTKYSNPIFRCVTAKYFDNTQRIIVNRIK